MKKQIFLLMMTICTTMQPNMYDEIGVAEDFLGKSVGPNFEYMQAPVNNAWNQANNFLKNGYATVVDNGLKALLYCMKTANEMMGYPQSGIPQSESLLSDLDGSIKGSFEFGNAGVKRSMLDKPVVPEGIITSASSLASQVSEVASTSAQKGNALIGSQLTSSSLNNQNPPVVDGFWGYLETGKKYASDAMQWGQGQYNVLSTTQKFAIVGVTAFAGLIYLARKNKHYDEDVNDEVEESKAEIFIEEDQESDYEMPLLNDNLAMDA